VTNELDKLREEARGCRRCDLWRNATQTVFGEGLPGAELMLVGEQPGDQEDVTGRPFVGPAGRLLREALAEAGFDVSRVYVTNAVKHFKWTPRGKRRIHEKPNLAEIAACHVWLASEIAAVHPRAIVALGATAARALFGKTTAIGPNRGRLLESELAPIVSLTVHPSSILRSPDDVSRRQAREQFIADLRGIAKHLGTKQRGARRAER
jgi:uracil-DNA glycosylase